MVSFCFALTLLSAAATWLVLWRKYRLRSSGLFHLAALAVGAALFGTTLALSAWVETPEGGIPFVYYARVLIGTVAWMPFVLYVVVTWMRTLGAAAQDGVTSAEARIEDARRALEFGQDARAWKSLRAVLDEDAGNIEARSLMAEVHLKRGKYDLALGSLRLATVGADSDPQFAKFCFKAAVLLNEHMGDPKAAAKELDLIRRRMSDTPEAAKAQDWIVRLMDEAVREES